MDTLELIWSHWDHGSGLAFPDGCILWLGRLALFEQFYGFLLGLGLRFQLLFANKGELEF